MSATYKIIDIRDVNGVTRADGRYPQRIGSVIRVHTPPQINMVLAWEYIADNQGNPKDGCLTTSMIHKVTEEKDGCLIVRTTNSEYALLQINT